MTQSGEPDGGSERLRATPNLIGVQLTDFLMMTMPHAFPSSHPARVLNILMPLFVLLSFLSEPLQSSSAQAQLLHEPNLELLAQQERKAAGREFTSKAGRFAITFPQKPKIEVGEDDIDGAPITIHSFSVEHQRNAYVVAYSDMPRAYLRQGKQAVLNEISRAVMSDFNLSDLVATGTNSRLASHPGKIFRLSSDEMTLDARFYLVDRRMYLLLGVSDEAQAVERFIQSFNLL